MHSHSSPLTQASRLRALTRATALTLSLVGLTPILLCRTAGAQAAPATPASRQIGTVKGVEGSTVTLATDAGAQVTVSVSGSARILQLPPGSTDLKAAQAAAISDVAVGDRVLVTGAPGDSPAQFTANRVILMKSGAIAQKHESEESDWQKRGTGGIVSAIDPATGTLTVSAAARKLQVVTSSKTVFRRYAGDSIKFEDAKIGTLAQIQVGDQLRVRGGRSQTDAGVTIAAEEIVSGSFKNLSGTLLSVDAGTGRLSLKDLTTKRNMTVLVTSNSQVKALPPDAATRFAARQRGSAAGAPGAATSPGSRPAGEAAAATVGKSADNAHPAGDPGATGGAGGPGSGGRSAGGDLSQLVARLPLGAVSDLHPGEAVMIVASSVDPGSDSLTAITLLSGVEPILAAAPAGGTGAVTLSPWSVGGSGGADAGAGGADGGGGGGGAPR